MAKRRKAQNKRRQGVRREAWWADVQRKEKRRDRVQRAKQFHQQTKRERMESRVSLSKHSRWQRQQAADFRQAQLQSKRRAVLIHENGNVSPVKMLPFTTHSKGVIGSFLGGTPQVLAARPENGVVLLGIQDSICDDEWELDAYELLKSLNLQKRVGKIYGRALCVRFRPYLGNVLLDDMPLTMFTTGSCANVFYTPQVQAPVEEEEEEEAEKEEEEEEKQSNDDDEDEIEDAQRID